MRAGGTCYIDSESDTSGNLTRRPKLTPPKLSSQEGGGDWLEVQGGLEDSCTSTWFRTGLGSVWRLSGIPAT